MIYRRIIVVYRVSLRTSVISLVRWEGVYIGASYVWQTFEAEEYNVCTHHYTIFSNSTAFDSTPCYRSDAAREPWHN